MTLPTVLQSCEVRSGTSEAAIDSAEEQLKQSLPLDYKNVLLQSDGLEGFIGDNAFLLLWSTSELAELNDAYAVAEFIPGVTLIGTDGADTGYGFRTDHGCLEYISVPLVGMAPNGISVMGESFINLLDRLTRPRVLK